MRWTVLTGFLSLTAVKKICFPHFDESHQSYNQLLFEAKTLAQLSHPNIVQYYNSWIELSEPTNAGKPLEETFQSFLLQLPNTGNCRKSYPGLDDGSLSESIDSSITAITFTEVRSTFAHYFSVKVNGSDRI